MAFRIPTTGFAAELFENLERIDPPNDFTSVAMFRLMLAEDPEAEAGHILEQWERAMEAFRAFDDVIERFTEGLRAIAKAAPSSGE